MNEEPSTESAVDHAIRLAKAIRFAVATIVLGFTFLNSKACLDLPRYRRLLSDLLHGAPLPWLTVKVFEYEALFHILSLLLSVLTVATLFDRKPVRSFYLLGIVSLVSMAEYAGLSSACAIAMNMVFQAMQGP